MPPDGPATISLTGFRHLMTQVETAVKGDDAKRLQEALARLPDAQAEVITLAYYGQLSHTEIAAQLGLPPGTVKGRMRLGLQKLRADNA